MLKLSFNRRAATIIQSGGGALILIIGIIQNIFLVPFYLKFITLSEYGEWLSIYSILGLQMILTGGLNEFFLSRMVSYNAIGDRTKLGQVFRSSIVIYAFVALVYLLVSAVSVQLCVLIFDIRVDEVATFYKAFLIAAFSFAISIILQAFYDFYSARLAPLLAIIVKLISLFVAIVLCIVLMNFDYGILSFAWSLILGEVVAASLFFSLVLREKTIELFGPLGGTVVFREGRRNFVPLFLATAGNKIIDDGPQVLITSMLGAELTGFYVIIKKLSDLALRVARIFATSLLPSLGSLRLQTDKIRQGEVISSLFYLFIIFSLFSFCLYFSFNRSFIFLWVGLNVDFVSGAIFFIGLHTVLFSVIEFCKYASFSAAKFNYVSILTILHGFFSIGLAFVLLPYFGLAGAPIGFALSGTIFCCLTVINFMRVFEVQWRAVDVMRVLIFCLCIISVSAFVRSLHLTEFIAFLICFFVALVLTAGSSILVTRSWITTLLPNLSILSIKYR